MDQICNCSLGYDYLEFKRQMFGEVLSLKEWIANNTNSVSEENSEEKGKYNQNYIGNLQKRIYSLERQLVTKQSIIEKLLDLSKTRGRPHSRYEMPKGVEPALLSNTSRHKCKDIWNVVHPESYLNNRKEGSIGKVCTTVPVNRQRKKARKNKKNSNESLNPTKGREQDGMATDMNKMKIIIVGDPQLWFLNTEKKANDYRKVNIEFKPGMNFREALQKTGKLMHGFDIIPIENILYSNLNNDGLHLNPGGVRKFAGNLIQFVKYC